MTACATIADVRAPRAGGTLRTAMTAVRARPRLACGLAGALTAALVACTVWFALGQTGSARQADGEALAVPVSDAATPRLDDEAGHVRRGRCATCGVVVGIRDSQPSGFEFTVRLRDGSMRLSPAASRGTWHIGDAVMLMGGAAVAGQ